MHARLTGVRKRYTKTGKPLRRGHPDDAPHGAREAAEPARRAARRHEHQWGGSSAGVVYNIEARKRYHTHVLVFTHINPPPPNPQSALLLRGFTDAALARIHALAPSSDSSPSSLSSSHRAAIAYLLHEWLRALEPSLFPPPVAASKAKVSRCIGLRSGWEYRTIIVTDSPLSVCPCIDMAGGGQKGGRGEEREALCGAAPPVSL